MPAPLRISFVAPEDGLSGAVRAIASHARALAQRGHRVVVASSRAPAPAHAKRLQRLLGGARPVPAKGHLSGLPVGRRVVESGRPVRDADLPDADVVVATGWDTAQPVAELSARKGAKAYLVQDFGAHEGQPLDRVAASWRLPLHKIAVSRWLGDLVRAHVGGNALDVVPHGIDPHWFEAPPRGRHEELTVGFAYATQPHKGLALMLAAIAAAREHHALRLVSYGAGRPRPALPADTHYLASPSDRALVGAYQSCDVWLFGSSREGFGLPVLEAMACRTPVIAVRAGAAPDLVGAGGGVLLDTHTPDEMANAIGRFAEMSRDEWAAHSERAAAVARSYPLERATTGFEAALYRAVEGASAGS